MLLIGDLHITSRYKEKILSTLHDWIENNSNEKNIVFLGDYVYHFSYDRNALLALYNFFLWLFFEKKKNVYILAGNHDWLGNNFVFEEAQKISDILGLDTDNTKHGKIKFITSPIIEDIEGEKVLFVPYMINPIDVNINNTNSIETNQLLESDNKNEKLSGYLNLYLDEKIKEHGNLTIIHHYYINNTKFPSQKSLFKYKDLAISERFLENDNIRLISGHLHQGFTYKNYLCTGSVWSTSSLENNQNKYLWKYRNKNACAATIDINPYLLLIGDKTIDQQELDTQRENIKSNNKKNFESEKWKISFENSNITNTNNMSIYIKVSDINYDNIDKYISTDLKEKVKDIKLKKEFKEISQLTKELELSSKNLTENFADRKEILKSYLQTKYGDEYSKYEQAMNEMKII